ncbi:hypothetical protein KEM60_01826 [Austwickia sp. TVS 96-490-7B]|nr:hypothetical protein [Austwickia sp. TVS 96-490-7B]
MPGAIIVSCDVALMNRHVANPSQLEQMHCMDAVLPEQVLSLPPTTGPRNGRIPLPTHHLEPHRPMDEAPPEVSPDGSEVAAERRSKSTLTDGQNGPRGIPRLSIWLRAISVLTQRQRQDRDMSIPGRKGNARTDDAQSPREVEHSVTSDDQRFQQLRRIRNDERQLLALSGSEISQYEIAGRLTPRRATHPDAQSTVVT